MSLKQIKADEDNLVDFHNPSRNGQWNFVISEGVIEREKKMNKLTISIPVPDVRDLLEHRYSVTISMDGKTIYAKSPIAPKYLIEDYKKLYQGADHATLLGHSVYATRVNSFDESQRTETIAYSIEYPVCTMFFNKSRHETANANGVYETQAKVGSVHHNAHGVDYVKTIFYVEVAFSHSIVATEPADLETELLDALKTSLNLSGNLPNP